MSVSNHHNPNSLYDNAKIHVLALSHRNIIVFISVVLPFD